MQSAPAAGTGPVRRRRGLRLTACVAVAMVGCTHDFGVFASMDDASLGDAPTMDVLAPDSSDGPQGPMDDASRADGDAGDAAPLMDAGVADADPDAAADADGDADGATCSLPPGATLCCGTVPCTNAGGVCKNACAKCSATCTDPLMPICCARGPNRVTCASDPGAC